MKSLKFLALLISIEGLFAVMWTIFSPPDSQNLIFMTFTRTKIILLAGLCGLLLVFLFLVWTLLRQEHPQGFFTWLDRLCLEQKKLASFLILFLFLPITLLVVILWINSIPLDSKTYESWAPVTYPVLFALAHRFLVLWLWLSISAIELAAFLGLRYRKAILQLETWAWKYSGATLIGLFIAVVTIFHWMVLAFQLRFFTNNPAWYWSIHALPFTSRDFFFILGILALLAIFFWSLVRKKASFISLIILFMTGWLLQIGIGYISGAGYSSLRERYFSTYHQVYPLLASQNQTTILETTRDYENLFGNHLFTNTKPPGLMAFYIGLNDLINSNNPGLNEQQRYERLSWSITYIFPFMAMLIIFLIYVFTKRLLGFASDTVPMMSALLYIFCPNIILFSLFADQALYPILFLAGVSLTILVIRKQSFLLACLFGMLLYLAIFFAFTMLPLYLFTAIYLVLDYWFNRKDRSLKTEFKVVFGIMLGTIILFFIFLVLLNYNFFPRFAQAVQINHNFDFYLRVDQKLPTQPESFAVKLQQIAGAAWLNNLDFAAAIGFPVYILFLLQAIRLISLTLKGIASPAEIVLTSLLSSFIILNLAGTAQGEVPRLWMFWVPFFVIFASLELIHISQKNIRLLTLTLVLAQILTLILTFHFQDLIM